MKLPITGHCLCGSIRYSIIVQPKQTGLCFCNSCQRKSGSDYISYLVVTPESIKITGDVKWYPTIGDSGQPKKHGFCQNCGSSLFGKPELWQHIFIVYSGSLDDKTDYVPQRNIWLQDAQSWTCINHDLESFKKNPK